jgi:shikimate dehydrogenase
MKLGLLGFPISHSLSPKLYQQFLGDKLTSYELFSFEKASDVPSLEWFAERVSGLNITSPYKTHFMNEIIIDSELVKSLGAVNTLAFTDRGVIGTNTDLIAVVEILKKYLHEYGDIEISLLGDGVMANLTKIVARDLKIPVRQYSRKLTPNFENLDLSKINQDIQQVVINSCARQYVFQGKLKGEEIFWDYNYSFLPHQNTLPSAVMAYHDGQEMLELQAKAAIKFWKEVNAKLK